MRQINVDELKNIQLEITDVVMKFCDEHDIYCFLNYGTLLGAVRHKGYIPWDDDIDLGMLRPDYDKFMSLFNAENTRYKFRCLENDPNCPSHCGKVFDTTTELYEPDRKTGLKLAINIDIFVMDNAPDDDKVLKKLFIRQYIFRKLHFARILPVSAPANGNLIKRIITRCALLAAHIIPTSIMPKNYFAVKLLEGSKRYISENTKRVGWDGRAIDREKISNFIYADFEGRKYKIPSGYDEWLTTVYGDYMTPPSERDKASHHHFEAFVQDNNGE